MSTNKAKQYEPHRFSYKWNIADGYPAPGIENHGKKVFGTFVCGGGSTMGYKLAGYHHLGGVELDPKIASVYEQNHHPENMYCMDIREFNKLQDLPAELYQLDLLDGSPPRSTFSTAGSRENAWGKEKKFAEGQELQTLDDLVFVYCDTIEKLMPKCFLLENVSGLVKGNAKSYAKRIVTRLNEIGYHVQVFLLNAANMGVPQARERVFFIGHRKEYNYLPKLELKFNEEPIKFGEIQDDNDQSQNLPPRAYYVWSRRTPTDLNFSDIVERVEGKKSLFNWKFVHKERVAPTLTANDCSDILYDYPRTFNEYEMKCVSTFAQDYTLDNIKKLCFLCGMSVPPIMTAQIAYQIYKQWLSNIHE